MGRVSILLITEEKSPVIEHYCEPFSEWNKGLLIKSSFKITDQTLKEFEKNYFDRYEEKFDNEKERLCTYLQEEEGVITDELTYLKKNGDDYEVAYTDCFHAIYSDYWINENYNENNFVNGVSKVDNVPDEIVERFQGIILPNKIMWRWGYFLMPDGNNAQVKDIDNSIIPIHIKNQYLINSDSLFISKYIINTFKGHFCTYIHGKE